MKTALDRMKQLLDNPTKGKWDTCCDIVYKYKRAACEHPCLWNTVIGLVAYMRTWYIERAKIQGFATTRRFYGSMEGSYFKTLRSEARAKPRPSVPQDLKGPLPGPESNTAWQFLKCLNTHASIRAVLARIQYHEEGMSPMAYFAIPFRGGAVCGIALADLYVNDKISRAAWKLSDLPPEQAMIEDLIQFQCIANPGIRTRTLIRLAPAVNAFVRTMTLDQTRDELMAAIVRLEKYGRIFQVEPGRWDLTHSGRMATWCDLPTAWESCTALGKYPPMAPCKK